MNKRILSAAMALSLMAAQVPMTSYAQGASMTEEDLIAALEQAQAGGTVELSGSVTLTSQLVIEKEIVLDGNGYTITKGEGEDVFPNNAGILVTAGATLRDLTVEPRAGITASSASRSTRPRGPSSRTSPWSRPTPEFRSAAAP